MAATGRPLRMRARQRPGAGGTGERANGRGREARGETIARPRSVLARRFAAWLAAMLVRHVLRRLGQTGADGAAAAAAPDIARGVRWRHRLHGYPRARGPGRRRGRVCLRPGHGHPNGRVHQPARSRHATGDCRSARAGLRAQPDARRRRRRRDRHGDRVDHRDEELPQGHVATAAAGRRSGLLRSACELLGARRGRRSQDPFGRSAFRPTLSGASPQS